MSKMLPEKTLRQSNNGGRTEENGLRRNNLGFDIRLQAAVALLTNHENNILIEENLH